ncbi:hypothetical protein V2G26_019569 [Clonostachys chloroleuca]
MIEKARLFQITRFVHCIISVHIRVRKAQIGQLSQAHLAVVAATWHCANQDFTRASVHGLGLRLLALVGVCHVCFPVPCPQRFVVTTGAEP